MTLIIYDTSMEFIVFVLNISESQFFLGKVLTARSPHRSRNSKQRKQFVTRVRRTSFGRFHFHSPRVGHARTGTDQTEGTRRAPVISLRQTQKHSASPIERVVADKSPPSHAPTRSDLTTKPIVGWKSRAGDFLGLLLFFQHSHYQPVQFLCSDELRVM